MSRTPALCLAESQWIMLGLWLLGLLCVRRQREARQDPRRWSTAQARDAVRRALRGTDRRGGNLDHELRHAVHDSYWRQGSKAARNYPRKKREKPPGPPKIKPATLNEVQRAARLKRKLSLAA